MANLLNRNTKGNTIALEDLKKRNTTQFTEVRFTGYVRLCIFSKSFFKMFIT